MQLHSDTHLFDDFSGQREKSLTMKLNSCLPEIKNNNKLETTLTGSSYKTGVVKVIESTYPWVVIVGSAFIVLPACAKIQLHNYRLHCIMLSIHILIYK